MAIRALIVDDEPLARQRLRRLLQDEPDVEIVGECADGGDAVAGIRNLHSDLVFLDVQMPVLDGYEATRAMRHFEAERSQSPTPILALSAHAFDEKLERSLAEGCSGFLTKPITREQLITAIRKYLPE